LDGAKPGSLCIFHECGKPDVFFDIGDDHRSTQPKSPAAGRRLGPGFWLSMWLPATTVLRTLGQIPFAFDGHLQTLRRPA
jgi:hypothetical protein